MTIRSVVIAVLSDLAHIRILDPSQIMLICYILLYDRNQVEMSQSHPLNIFYIYGYSDASSLANLSYSN